MSRRQPTSPFSRSSKTDRRHRVLSKVKNTAMAGMGLSGPVTEVLGYDYGFLQMPS